MEIVAKCECSTAQPSFLEPERNYKYAKYQTRFPAFKREADAFKVNDFHFR